MSVLVRRRRRPSATLGENALGQTLDAGHTYAAVPRRMIGLDLAQVLQAVLDAGRCGQARVHHGIAHYCLLEGPHDACGWVRPVNLGGPELLDRQVARAQLARLVEGPDDVEDEDPFAEDVVVELGDDVEEV